MYGKWLFKEIKTEYGLCKVEIFRKNFTDTAIEIGALESNSLTLAMENLGNITDPIGKSVCSFSIIDTDQIDYDEFFTPDATAYMVVVSTKTEEGAYVTRWSGYITPDFFAENLSYRTPISISARDNIGYLNDVDFDLDASTITVRGLIEAAFNRIAEDYPMQIVFATQKQTAEGVLAIDATISTMLLREGSWYEAIETVLHDLGLQMRWVDNNTIAVLDLSQIPEYYATQAFNFVDASGYREILPAWRELAQEQDYGLRENFFEGQINNANLRFVKEETLNLPLSMGGVTGNPVMKYYAPSNWGVAGSTLTINTDNYKYIGSYGQEPSGQGGRIYFTGVQKDAANLPQNYMSYRQPVYVSQRGKMSIAFNAFNSLLATNKTSAETLQVYNPADRFMDFATGDSLQLGLKVNVFLHVGTKTFILGDTWEEVTGAETNSLYFTLDKVGQLGANGTTTPTEQEITIDVNTIPYNGELELRIYGFCIHEKTNLQEDAGLATYDWLKMVSYIDDVRYSYERELATGQGAKTEIAPLHNVKESKSYKFGQVPVYAGGINAYAGGLYNASKNMESMVLFQRNTNTPSYNLLELVGREVIHFNKKNYNKLSGTIRNLAKEPLMFNRLFVRNGKRYAPFAYSLNIISNQMEITTMQEVENYVTESFSEINSAVTTGGAIVSAGNNTVMQYSQDAGNTKRIYELTAATEEEKKDTWVMIDGTAFPEARKINVKDLEGLNEEQVEAYLTANKYATQSWVKGITDDLETDIANRVLYTDFEKLEDSVTEIAGYFTNGSANNALKLGGQLPSYYATKSALDTTNSNVVSLTQRMGTAESGISTNKTNIASLTTDLSNLTSRVSTAEGTIKGHTDAIALNANNIAANIKSIATNATAITAVSNRVQKFEDVIDIDDNGDVYIKGTRNFYTEGGTIGMAGLGSGGSGGGGGTAGLGSVTVRVNGQDYITDASGIVTIPNYPSLSGYATQSWVGANYLGLGGGTIDGELYIGKQDNTAYKYLRITRNSTVVELANAGGVGVLNIDGVGFSFSSSTALWNGNTLYHTGNFNPSNYLPLSGGTITGPLKLTNSLELAYSSTALSIITPYGQSWFGMMNESFCHIYTNAPAFYMDKPLYVDNGNAVIHSGNYSDYALPKSGGTISNNGWANQLNLNAIGTTAGLRFSIDGVLKGILNVDEYQTLRFQGAQEYEVYHTGNFNPANYLPLSGGTIGNLLTIASSSDNKIILNETGSDVKYQYIEFQNQGVRYGILGTFGDDDIKWNNKTLIHSGNYTDYALSKNGGTIYGSLMISNASGAIILYNDTIGNYGYLTYQGGVNWRVTDSGWGASYAILHEGNYSSYALPLSGGTIDGNLTVVNYLYLGNSNTLYNGASSMIFRNASSSADYGTNIVNAWNGGNTRIILNNTAVYFRDSSGNDKTIIHSGNIGSQSVNYASSAGNADTLDGYHAAAFMSYAAGSNYVQANLVNSDLWSLAGGDGYIEYYDNGIWFNSAWGKITAVNGFVGALAGNASSATKLQTARTIWGKSFDGSANVSGDIHLGNYSDFEIGTGYSYDNTGRYNKIVFGCGTAGLQYYSGGWTSGNVASHKFIVGNTNTTAVTIMNGGNVLIGTTTDWGFNLASLAMGGNKISGYLGSGGGVFFGNIAEGYGTAIWTQGNGNGYIQQGRSNGGAVSYNLVMQHLGGNVLIGTTTDNGYKLQVAGALSLDNVVLANTRSALLVQTPSGNSWFGMMNDSYCHIYTDAFQFYMDKGLNTPYLYSRGDLEAAGNLTVTGGATFGGDVYSEGTMAMARLTSSSDAKLKDNIKWLSADRAMRVVRALRPTEWDWKKDHTHSFGFIAQDVQPIIPEMVCDINDTLRLEYNQLHAFEIGAIQHIDSEVEILKRRVNELENELKQYRRNA